MYVPTPKSLKLSQLPQMLGGGVAHDSPTTSVCLWLPEAFLGGLSCRWHLSEYLSHVEAFLLGLLSSEADRELQNSPQH